VFHPIVAEIFPSPPISFTPTSGLKIHGDARDAFQILLDLFSPGKSVKNIPLRTFFVMKTSEKRQNKTCWNDDEKSGAVRGHAEFIQNRTEENMSRDIKTIKKDILDKFRSMDSEENDAIPEEWLENEYLPVLDLYERKDFEKAVRQLSAKGVLKYTKGTVPKLLLTEKGANLIH
jgi:hypothetical protein